jgi:hypothetical protein
MSVPNENMERQNSFIRERRDLCTPCYPNDQYASYLNDTWHQDRQLPAINTRIQNTHTNLPYDDKSSYHYTYIQILFA